MLLGRLGNELVLMGSVSFFFFFENNIVPFFSFVNNTH